MSFYSLPTIEINNSTLYTILKVVFMVAAFLVVAINVLSVSALPANTTDWDFGLEFVDDNLEEQEELEDEKEHEKESRDHDRD